MTAKRGSRDLMVLPPSTRDPERGTDLVVVSNPNRESERGTDLVVNEAISVPSTVDAVRAAVERMGADDVSLEVDISESTSGVTTTRLKLRAYKRKA